MATLKHKKTAKKAKKQPDPPPVSDDSTDDEVPQRLKTTEEEKRGTIPGSAQASAAALAHMHAQANPSVGRGPQKRVVRRQNSVAMKSPSQQR